MITAAVVVNYTRCSQETEQVAQQIKAEGSEAIAIEADVTEEDQVQAMFHTMFDRYGSIDILVNNMDAHKDAAFTALTLAAWARPEGEAELLELTPYGRLRAGWRYRPCRRLAGLGCLGLHDRDDALCRRGYALISLFGGGI
jgi:hypothetical protein